MNRGWLTIGLGCLLLLASCGAEKATPTPLVDTSPDLPQNTTPQDTAPLVPDVPVIDTATPDVSVPKEDTPNHTLVPLPPGQNVPLMPSPAPRPRRRMNLDQLQATLIKATELGDWFQGSSNLFERYAEALGRPDYESSVLELLDPGLLFEKVMGDATRTLCPSLIEKEVAAAPEERIFIKYVTLTDTVESAPDGVEQNLRMLILRFHSRYVPVGSEELDPWRALFQSGSQATTPPDPITGWRRVCAALLSHPDMFSY